MCACARVRVSLMPPQGTKCPQFENPDPVLIPVGYKTSISFEGINLDLYQVKQQRRSRRSPTARLHQGASLPSSLCICPVSLYTSCTALIYFTLPLIATVASSLHEPVPISCLPVPNSQTVSWIQTRCDLNQMLARLMSN